MKRLAPDQLESKDSDLEYFISFCKYFHEFLVLSDVISKRIQVLTNIARIAIFARLSALLS